ncbi:MAG: hypothetical protein LBE83_04725, partial [Propionibacteriaceae bacterium]|nr:hypothetical protein [Propionibacteriaceae bacterium]
MRFIDAVLDLLVEGACPGCSVPGALCVNCWSAINSGQAGPHPRAGICLPLWAGGDYVSPLPQI